VPENVRKAFNSVDTLGSGAVDRYEIKRALRQLGLEADSVQTHGVLQKYDTTGRGTLSVQQFNKLVAELQALQRSQPAPAAAKPASPSAQAAAARRHATPHRTAPHRTAPHRTAPHRTAPPTLAFPRWLVRTRKSSGAHAPTVTLPHTSPQ
jgi:hypothetical protein